MKIVAKFMTSDGKVTTATFDRATGTVVSDDGRKGTYKREGNILKISGDQSFTLTMEGDIPASGRLHGAIHLVDRDDGDDDDRFCWLNG